MRVGNDTTLTFTIGNMGTANLTGLSVSIDPPSAFSVASQPGSPSIPGPSGATTFSIRFAPASGGAASGALRIASNDADENPFDIILGGIGQADCVVGPWSEWSACCNAAQSRTRLVLLPASPGGAACPALVETRACVDSIPVVTLTWPRAGSTYPVGIPVLFTASFTDAGPGAHTGSWNTGAVTETAIITEPSDGSPGSASVLHTFAAAGSYPVTLNLNSTCGTLDSATVVVVAAAETTQAFPQAGILDTFSRANGAIGSDWTDMTSTFSIQAHRLVQAGGESYVQWQGATFGANQEVFVTLSTVSASTLEHNLMLKTQGATWKTGHLEVSYVTSASQVNVYSYTPGSGFTIQGTIPGVTFASGDRFGARAFADGRVEVFRNATLLGRVSIAGWAYSALGGHIGLSAVNAASSRFDNFGGGDFVPTALVGVAPKAAVETALLSLSNAFPNPTHGGVGLSLTLPHAEEVGMRILDIQGRQVWHTQPQRYGAGRWSLAWAGQTALGNASPGLYFAMVRVGENEFLRRIAVVR